MFFHSAVALSLMRPGVQTLLLSWARHSCKVAPSDEFEMTGRPLVACGLARPSVGLNRDRGLLPQCVAKAHIF